MIEIEKENIKPYLSILLGFSKDDHGSVHRNIVKIIKEHVSDSDLFSASQFEALGEVAEVSFTTYKISKKPSWLADHEAQDIEHHVFVSFKVDAYFAFYFSEKTLKDSIREYFGKSPLSNVRPIPINQLNGHFINEDKVRMLWLSSIEGKHNFKADSKVLGGDSVTDALDPLIDQSYMMSAVRTELWTADSKRTVGINAFKSSIWRGPCKNWQVFENRVVEILDLLNSTSNSVENPISVLSYPIPNCSDLKKPYDFSLVDYEFFPEEEGQRRKDLLRTLQFDYTAEIEPAYAFNDSDILIYIYFKGKKVGDVLIEPEISDYLVDFKIKSENVIKKKEFNQYIKIFRYPELIKCWFESGHAIVNGMVFKTGYQDVKYDNFLWADYENYDLKKEKPGNNPVKPQLKKIGMEKSLFCWVKNRWNGDWLTPDSFNTSENPKGWLYCDDGAGEKADFIHLTNFKGHNLISLIHVKAAKSSSAKRRISVGAHDIVLNQGIKNIRYCMRKTLIEDLRERLDSAKSKECWCDGKPAKGIDFLNALEQLSGVSSIKYRVVIIQPHTQKDVYQKSSNSNSRRQLDVLLVSAENAIRSSGSEFYIVGLDDGK